MSVRPSARRLALGIAGLVALGVGAVVVSDHVRSASAGASAVSRPVAAVADDPGTLRSATPAATTVASSTSVPDDIMFVGASYTAGVGASPHEGYAYLAGPELGWRSQVYGFSGSGYLNPGPQHAGTFAALIAQLPTRPAPTMVLIQGGRNDAGYPAAALRTAIMHTVDVTRRRYRGAQIVFLGPIPATTPVEAPVVTVERVLKSTAATCHVVFIDPIAEKWITTTNEKAFAGPVAGHPGDDGYAYIAHRLVADIRGLRAGART